MCLTIHDTPKVSADQRIDVSMRMIYVELLYFDPLFRLLFVLVRSCIFSFLFSSLSCLAEHFFWRSRGVLGLGLALWLDFAALVGGIHVSE